MCSKTKTKRKLQAFHTFVEAMYVKPFCVDSLLRKVSNYYRTTKFPSGKTFGLMNRVSGHCVRCSQQQTNSDGVTLVFVDFSTRWGEKLHFEFHVNSNKELLQKLLKQELI